MSLPEPAVINEEWLRDHGHDLAADARAATKQTARILLDRLLAGRPDDRQAGAA